MRCTRALRLRVGGQAFNFAINEAITGRSGVPASLSRDPAVEAPTGIGAFIEIPHLDTAQIISRNVTPNGADIDSEQSRGVEPEDLLFHRTSHRLISVLLDEAFGNLKPPEGFDLPLRRAVPNRIGPPQHVVGAERGDQFAE